MNEGYNYQLLTGIVKVIRPNGKPVLGISDGVGGFLWLPTEKIIMSHPMQYENWQTTIFAIDPTWKIIWKTEQKWEEFKSSYPSNTKPILQPVPEMFLPALSVPVQQPIQRTTLPIQQPIVPTGFTLGKEPQIIMDQQPTITQPTQNPVYPSPTVSLTSNTLVDKLKRETLYGLQAEDPNVQVLKHIAVELTNIRKLLERYLGGSGLKGVDKLSVKEVVEQYGAPPEPEVAKITESKANKDGLPNIFGD